jgi:eukaryotic-like serine/threonine-protein kinase
VIAVGDRFQIERLVASGGMGQIYRAIDRTTDELVAVKLLAVTEADLAARFEREAAILAELRHPAIVRYLAHGRGADGRLFLAMEWLEGEDLGARLATGDVDLAGALALATRAADALAAAHARGIVHRDVKPSNLFLVDWRFDRTKLLDFGVARLAGTPKLTATGEVVGTPLYMAPEQARGARDLGPEADVFALGCVLYRCVTGQSPFPGRTAAELLDALLDPRPAARARDHVAELPPELDELLARMLAKEPAARPRDGAAVLAALAAVPAGEAARTPASQPAGGQELQVGERVDRYRIEALLGRGGMGTVYEAFDERLERRVALKVIPAGTAGSAEHRFLREARAAAALDHPNVVIVHDTGRAGPWLYVAMELARGPTLGEAARRPGVERPRLVRWLLETARALAAAHARGLVHRDVKPDNVVIAGGSAKVLDFGVARRLTGPDPRLTAEGAAIGTPAYMAPEQVRGEAVDARSDQFAWGVTAFEVLAGQLPWRSPTNPLVIAAAILHQPVPPLTEVVPDLPPELAAVVARALARDPGDRFASMDDIAAALEPFAESRERTPRAGGLAFAPTESRPRPRRPSLWRVAAVGVMVALAALALARPWQQRAATRVVSSDAEAARLWERGLRLWRSQSLVQATEAWSQAVTRDPELAPALLRLALEAIAGQTDTAQARSRYQAAGAAQQRLDERERALYLAAAPMFGAERDAAAWRAALEELAGRYRGDAEILYWKAHAELASGDAEAARRSARAAIAADPDFLPPYVLEWNITADLGEDNVPLLERCAARFPRSGSCAGALVWLAMHGSDCPRLERLSRDYASAVPDHFIGARGRALAFHARGAPREAVEELLKEAATRMSLDTRIVYRDLLPELAIAHGDFAGAERALRAELDGLARLADAGPRALGATRLAALLWEEDRADEARALVADFLHREEALAAPQAGTTFQLEDGRADVLEMAGRVGALGAAELARRRAELMAASMPPVQRRVVQALLAVTPEDAAPLAETRPPPHPWGQDEYWHARALALAGRRDQAIAELREALARCDRLVWAIDVPRAQLLLGTLLEEAGDTAGARAAYQGVIDAWGTATPASRTAAAARRRLSSGPMRE